VPATHEHGDARDGGIAIATIRDVALPPDAAIISAKWRMSCAVYKDFPAVRQAFPAAGRVSSWGMINQTGNDHASRAHRKMPDSVVTWSRPQRQRDERAAPHRALAATAYPRRRARFAIDRTCVPGCVADAAPQKRGPFNRVRGHREHAPAVVCPTEDRKHRQRQPRISEEQAGRHVTPIKRPQAGNKSAPLTADG